ncbi:MAG: hypothetical protein ABIY51_13880 [Ferruginibacter sp.]
MHKTFALASLIFFLALSAGLPPKKRCPASGDGISKEKKAFNTKKNRSITVAPEWEAEFLPLKNLLPSRQRIDKNLWYEGAYVYTEGYLTSAEEQGPESCNCKQASIKSKDGDVHMYLSLVPEAPKKNSLVVEMTPAFKKKHLNYADNLILYTKVRVYGFLFYDYDHENASFTTCTKCSNIWRKTCWEIHPVTSMEVIE